MKHTFRRLMAMLLTVSMITSMVGIIPVFADSYENQVVTNGDTQYYDEKGDTATKDEQMVSTSKTIEQTGENAFDITLNVVTTQNISSVNVSEDSAVVLVADLSGSMDYCATCGKSGRWCGCSTFESRISALKKAANSFLTTYKDNGDTDAARMFSMVNFSTNAVTYQDWTDVSKATNYNNVINTKINMITESNDDGWGDRTEKLLQGIGGGSTNIGAALTQAKTLLDSNSLDDSIKNVYVILMTDGDADNKSPAKTAATNIHPLATLYTVDFSGGAADGSWLSNKIASTPAHALTAADTSALKTQFELIATNIKLWAEAWTVTDPMGDFITYQNCKSTVNADEFSVNDDGTITWNLQKATPKINGNVNAGTATFTYEVTYSVTLDTDKAGFAERTAYATNGTTDLSYVIMENGVNITGTTPAKAGFDVPTVNGKYPTDYSYTVQHLKQTGVATDGEIIYTLADTETVSNVTKYSTATATEKDYTNFTFNQGSSTLSATVDSRDLVLKLYYDKIPTTVTVEHNYYTNTKTNEGIVSELTKTDTETPTPVYLNDSFSANARTGGGYSLAEGAATTQTITLKDTGNEIVFNYYKDEIDDQRSDVKVDVVHELTTYNYVLDTTTGRYVYDDGTVTTLLEESTDTYKYGESATVTTQTGDFTYTGITSDGGNLDEDTLTVSNLTNNLTTIKLSYEKYADNPNALKDVTVNHIYRTTTISIAADGSTSTVTAITDQSSTTTKDDYRVSETFSTTADLTDKFGNKYDADYEVVPNNSIIVGNDNNKITYEYHRTVDNRTATEVTVHHDYIYIYGTIDADGNYTTVTDNKTDLDHTYTYNEDVDGSKLYVGQEYTATPDTKGYTQLTKDADLTINKLEASGNNIYISYKLVDDLDNADITVKHYYTTFTETYVDGTLSVNKGFYNLGKTDKYDGHKGEKYTATPDYDYNGNKDYELVGTPTLTVNLNGSMEIKIFYVRTEQDFTETTVTVNHNFITTSNFVDTLTGKVVSSTSTETVTAANISVNDANKQLYAGMIYTAAEDASMDGRTGFTAAATNIETCLLVGDATANVINLNYTKTDDSGLVDATVQVIHHYTTKTTTLVDNAPSTSTNTESVTETLVTGKYAGEWFTATAKPNSFTQLTDEADYTNVVLTAGANTIEIFYETTNDYTKAATLDVTHVYTTTYTNGQAADVTTAYDEQVGSWATVTKAFAPDTYSGLYTVSGMVGSNDTLNQENCTITLDAGANTVTINYTREVENRIQTAVTVNHTYTTHDAYTDATTTDGTTTKFFTAFVEDGSFTANLLDTYNDVEYTFASGEKTIDLDADATLNVINLTYVLEIDTTPDEPDEPSTPPTTTIYYTLTTNWVDEDGNALADQEKTTRLRYTSTYETEQKDIEGYTFLQMADDSDPVSGTMKGHREVTYVYAPVTDVPETDIPLEDIPEIDPPLTDIPDGDTPLAEIPDGDTPLAEIPDEEIPLTNVPQTGDTRNFALLVSTALLSAVGLAWLMKAEYDEKKRYEK